MGKFSRDKGNRVERAIVAVLQRHRLCAERVPLSGAARGRFGGDVSVPFLGVDRRVEVKARRSGFAHLYDWLAEHDFLVVKADRREPLLVMRLSDAAIIAERVESGRAELPVSGNLTASGDAQCHS